RDHRNAEPVGHPHDPHRLAIAFGAGHAEIVPQPAFGRGPLLMPDEADALAAEASEAGDDRLVLAELAVAPDRHESGEQAGHVIHTVRALGMARDLGLLPGRERGIELFERLAGFGLEAGDLLADCYPVAAVLEDA